MASNLHSRATERGQFRPTGSKRVTAQHTLERVRNNQRRHRAHRREYIATLELKLGHAERRTTTLEEQVDALQAELARYRKQDASTSFLGRLEFTDGTPPAPMASPKDIDSQALGPLADAMERDTVTPSNQSLFQLLAPEQAGPELVDATTSYAGYNNTDGADNVTTAEALRQLVPVLQPANHIMGTPIAAASGSSGGGARCPSCLRNVPDVGLEIANYRVVGGTRSWLSAATLDSTPLAADSCCSSRRDLQPDDLTGQNYDFDVWNSPSVSGYTPQSPIPAYYTHTNDNESTMLCAEAYLLIERQNFKGMHQKDIATWLWTGFRKPPNAGEGCRVKTDLLFSLLAVISEAQAT
ncbi:hypothetical protein OIDMADRAFT_33838 [Oidiodendron maius Zn]|uniref:BZIP domain-containing protein n=1 Tax=Oidiodendron maius (strain Zn) TaxID=913774 RepID=A0A0C3GHY8_OIDMZ|nr:hypothetical protein OIDMADRAFT_33838 [Oidiodendron maius Zn]